MGPINLVKKGLLKRHAARSGVLSQRRIACLMLMLLTVLALAAGAAGAAGLELNDPDAYPGYTLFSPMGDTNTYLIDNNGNLAHTWASSHRPGLAAYLLEDGRLLRAANNGNHSVFSAGGAGGRVQMIGWDGSVSWDFVYSGDTYHSHHDVAYLPGGNVLLIAWEYKSAAEAEAAGRNPGLLSQGALWPDTIVEVRPDGANGGEVVWIWRVWDHLVQDYDGSKPNFGTVADRPELIDLNHATGRAGADWTHINSVAYNPELDQILLSVHGFNEIWVIDHSTTTEEAAGHSGGRYGKGGDILYRWGNPQAYGAGGSGDQKLYGQHDATWIGSGSPGAGDILIYNNGVGRPEGMYASVEQITPPLNADGSYARSGQAFGPEGTTWSYSADAYSRSVSGAQRLPNGNTLICVGESGTFIEVNSDGQQVWRYVNPISSGPRSSNAVFKVRRYSPDYAGLAGRGL